VSQGARARRSWPQRLLLVACAGLVVGLLGTAGALGYAYSKYSRISRVRLGTVLTEQAAATGAQNILLVGVDSADTLDPDDPARAGRDNVGGLRSDSMMILRVDPGDESAHLMSIPRDLWVPLASGGTQRINAAIQIGGPGELIDTIEEYLGVAINHYVQVDFAGFQGLVRAIDGVEVWFEHPTRDRNSGLDVTEPGCVSLDPAQALAYVRARHLQTFENGRWRTDPTGDHGRMSRQQDFIVRALRRSVDKGVRNPVTANRLVDAALDTVTVDDQLTADDIVDLAMRFRAFQPDRLVKHTLPVVGGNVGGASILRLVDREAGPVLDVFRGVDPEDLTPESIRVRVLNGTGEPGHASLVGRELASVGFAGAGTGDAESFDAARTVVRYPAGRRAAADLVARHLVGGARLEEVDEGLGGDVVVVTGADYTGVLAVPRPAAAGSGDEGGSDEGGAGTTDTTERDGSSSTTSSTVIGEVPEPPPGAGC